MLLPLTLNDLINMSEDDRYALFVAMRTDKELFARIIMGHIVQNVPPYQKEIYRSLGDPRIKNLCIIVFRGGAKRLSLNSKVLTPNGWVLNKDLKVGDKVVGSNGHACNIIALSDTVYRPLYRLKTRDGRSVLCDGEHQWEVERISGGDSFYKDKKIVMTTEELIEFPYAMPRLDKRYNKDNVECCFAIKNPSPVQFEEKDFLVDPYDLGVIIGDGSISLDTGFVRIHSSRLDVYETYCNMKWENKGEIITRNNVARFSLLGSGHLMKELGLMCNVYSKHIPKQYLFGSVEQRISLLQGLLDTDGTCSANKCGASFTTVSPQLAEDYVHLVRSLGGTAYVRTYTAPLATMPAYYIGTILPPEITPFRLSRKKCTYRHGRRTANAIVSIEYEKHDYGRCIMVDAEDHLFIAEDFLVTHNSTLGHTIDTTHDICMMASPFTIFISETVDQASADLISVQDELESNEMIRALFGNLAGNVWNKESMEASNGCYVMCRGTGSKIRGLKWKNQRPTKIKLDDTESESNTATSKQREDYSKWVFTNVMRAGMPNQTCFQFFGTIVHKDAFLAKAKDMPLFSGPDGRYLEIPIESDGLSAWPTMYPLSWIEKEKEAYRRNGKLALFLQEMYHIPHTAGKANFNVGLIKPIDGVYRNTEGVSYLLHDDKKVPLYTYIGIDPADSDKDSADETIITAIGILPSRTPGAELKKIVVLEVMSIKKPPSAVVKDICNMCERYQPKIVTFETQGGRDAYMDLLRIEMRSRGKFYAIKPFKSNQSKSNKWLNGLEPYINNGYISYLHDTPNMNLLISQLESYNSDVRDHDDTIDGLFLAIENSHAPSNFNVDETIRRIAEAKNNSTSSSTVNWYTI